MFDANSTYVQIGQFYAGKNVNLITSDFKGLHGHEG